MSDKVEAIGFQIKDVQTDHFILCATYHVGNSPKESEILGHFHIRVDKPAGRPPHECFIAIVDADDDTSQPGVTLPIMVMNAFAQFMESIAEDPTPILTERERNNSMARSLIESAVKNTN
jgi:hypothetical protein